MLFIISFNSYILTRNTGPNVYFLSMLNMNRMVDLGKQATTSMSNNSKKKKDISSKEKTVKK